MNAIPFALNLSEHCWECGALWLRVPGGCVCPHCGEEDLDGRDDPATVLRFASEMASSEAYFHFGDDRGCGVGRAA